MSIPTYLILGSRTCGRRGIALDIISRGLTDTDFCCVFVSANEKPSDFDKQIVSAPNAGIVKYTDTNDAIEKISQLDKEKITQIFFIADATKNLADGIEEFKEIIDQTGIHLARVWSVIDCTAFAKFPNEYRAFADALSHFADCLLLSRRDGATNKEVVDIMSRYEKMCQPHIFGLVNKHFHVKNPIELLVDEARRITMIFDEFDAVDDLELDEENLPEEPFSLERKPDPYLQKFQNGMRSKPIPDVSNCVEKAREIQQ